MLVWCIIKLIQTMLRTQEIGYFHLPVGCPLRRDGTSVTVEDVQKWIKESNPSFFKRTSYGTYAGVISILIGALTSITGQFKDSRFLKWVGGILAGVGALAAAIGKLFGAEIDVLSRVHNRILFGPDKEVKTTPEEEGIKHEDVEIKTPDGPILKGFFLPAPIATKKTVIFLNGRGYNASRCLKEFVELQKKVPVNVLMVDYRGFGKSTGEATPQGVVGDAASMYDYLVSKKGLTPDDISLFGVSLGGAVAIELANRREVNTLLVQSSFTTVEEVAEDQLPRVIPKVLKGVIRGIAQSEFNSRESIKNVRAKTVIISHGTSDRVIPIKHGEELFSLVSVPDKHFIPLEGAGHSDFVHSYDDDCYELFSKSFGVGDLCQIAERKLPVAA